ncbi:hypothetical protein PENTCL1PPCAC_24847, partial [Pristionchus entomophagus]
SSKYGLQSLHFAHSLITLTGERAREIKRRRPVYRLGRLKNDFPHFAHSFASLIDERVREIRRVNHTHDTDQNEEQRSMFLVPILRRLLRFTHV